MAIDIHTQTGISTSAKLCKPDDLVAHVGVNSIILNSYYKFPLPVTVLKHKFTIQISDLSSISVVHTFH